MKHNSKYFDRIRVKPEAPNRAQEHERVCQWKGCEAAATNRAPVGRMREGEFYWFCLDHVREYNKSYNYFSGMSDDDISSFQKASIVGHRPTWKMGVNSRGNPEAADIGRGARTAWSGRVDDPFDLIGRTRFRANEPPQETRRRKLKRLEKRSFDVLDLDDTASAADIKAKYKTLVKRHHPDANGGDRSTEERLRQIIQAYNHLKQAGFC